MSCTFIYIECSIIPPPPSFKLCNLFLQDVTDPTTVPADWTPTDPADWTSTTGHTDLPTTEGSSTDTDKHLVIVEEEADISKDIPESTDSKSRNNDGMEEFTNLEDSSRSPNGTESPTNQEDSSRSPNGTESPTNQEDSSLFDGSVELSTDQEKSSKSDPMAEP